MSTIHVYKKIKKLTTNIDPEREPHLNDKALSSFREDGQIITTIETRISQPVRKVERIDLPGMNGTMDASNSVYPTPRFDDRALAIDFLIQAKDKNTALKVIDAIHAETIMKPEKTRIRLGTEGVFYYIGASDKGIKVDQSHGGFLKCSIEFIVYPMVVLDVDDLFLWDDIDFEGYHFNDLTYTVSPNNSLIGNSLSFQAGQVPDEMRILVTGGDIKLRYVNGDGMTKSLNLAEGWNYLLMYDIYVGFPFDLINSSNAWVTVSFSFSQEALRDV